MKKLIILGLVLLMVVVFGTAVLAKADLQTLVPYGGDSAYPDASGKAIVNVSNGNVVLEITVSVKGLDAETEYEVKGCSEGGGDWTPIGFFTTNKNGNGHFHVNFLDGDTLPPVTHIYINQGAGNTLLMDEDY